MGLAVWGEDEAGPYQGDRWQPEGHPARYPHEYVRAGTAKIMTLFHPASGQVRVKGTFHTPNTVLHAWLKAEVTEIVAALPVKAPLENPATQRSEWERWQAGLAAPLRLPEHPPRLRLLLVMDNLKGHQSTDLVQWLIAQGVLPLFTPLGGSWLNMTESIQRILKKRALEGSYPRSGQHIIERFETVATHWNAHPTPFIWGGKRQARRQRARQRRLHRLGGSGAYTRRPIRRTW